jgi:hypothetical protein
MKKTAAALYLASCLFSATAFAEETPAYAQPMPSNPPMRKPANMSDVDPVYEEPGTRSGSNWSAGPHVANKDGYDGARVLFYYDPMSTYSKLVTNGGSVASQFGYQTVTGGSGGMQAMWSVWAPSDWEFQTGLDYMFPVNVQGAQSQTFGTFTVNSQSLNIMGFKALQVNYRINVLDNLTIAPYGGIGVYYGKNSVTLQTLLSQQNNIVNYTKLMAVYTAGTRVDFNFNRARTIAAGVGAEFFVPTKFTDQLSQSGSTSSELPGGESQLQSNMDFWTGIGCRLYIGVAAYF